MKFFMQFGIISAVCLSGTLFNKIVPLPMPAAVWGMIIMFVLLNLKIIKLNQVQEAADFLLSVMTVLFLPVSVGIMESFHIFKNEIFPIIVISVISLIICFFVTGKTAQFIIERKSESEKRCNK